MSTHFDSNNARKTTAAKNNLTLISKPHAHFQTISKSPVEFQKNRHKSVGGVAHTRYPLSIHVIVIMPEK